MSIYAVVCSNTLHHQQAICIDVNIKKIVIHVFMDTSAACYVYNIYDETKENLGTLAHIYSRSFTMHTLGRLGFGYKCKTIAFHKFLLGEYITQHIHKYFFRFTLAFLIIK